MKKLLYFVLVLIFPLIILSSCQNDNVDIISTCFTGYDFSHNIAKDKLNITTLMSPGTEIHGYEPSATDIKKVINSKIFIYVGGESDEWVEDILAFVDEDKTIVLNMFDILKNNNGTLFEEENPESAKENHEDGKNEDEYDEHVWNNLDNAVIIIKEIYKNIVKIDAANESFYKSNMESYTAGITKVRDSITELTKNKTAYMVFGDRFPLLYFVKEFNIGYDAAFKGCDSSHDVSSKTLINLINKAMDKRTKYIYTIELSNQEIANSIVNEIRNNKYYGKYDGDVPGIATFYSMHNISKDDFNKGVTYLDLMKKNYESLKLLIGGEA